MKKNYTRLQVDIGPETVAQINELVEETGARTKAAVVRIVIRFFGYILQKIKEGYTLRLVKGNDKIDVVIPF